MQLKTQLKYTAAIVAAALSMSTISLANAASVSISNSGFESSFDNWEDTEPSAISSDEYTGSKAAKITGSSGKFQQDITVDANTDYQLTAYISGHGKIGATIDGTSYTSSSSGNDDYELVTLSFNSGSETSVTIFGSYDGDEGRFDDFALEKIKETQKLVTIYHSIPKSVFVNDDYQNLMIGKFGPEVKHILDCKECNLPVLSKSKAAYFTDQIKQICPLLFQVYDFKKSLK